VLVRRNKLLFFLFPGPYYFLRRCLTPSVSATCSCARPRLAPAGCRLSTLFPPPAVRAMFTNFFFKPSCGVVATPQFRRKPPDRIRLVPTTRQETLLCGTDLPSLFLFLPFYCPYRSLRRKKRLVESGYVPVSSHRVPAFGDYPLKALFVPRSAAGMQGDTVPATAAAHTIARPGRCLGVSHKDTVNVLAALVCRFFPADDPIFQ